MFVHPDLVIEQARVRQGELIADADRHRLLKLAREWRHACRVSDRAAAHRQADAVARIAPVAAAPAAALAGTLAKCGRHVAGSAR